MAPAFFGSAARGNLFCKYVEVRNLPATLNAILLTGPYIREQRMVSSIDQGLWQAHSRKGFVVF
jgi:hypothetical protein